MDRVLVMSSGYIFAVWLHIVAAMVWVGGLVCFAAVLVPLSKQPAFEHLSSKLLTESGLRFRWVGWSALTVLVMTGIYILGVRGYTWGDVLSGGLWKGSFGDVLAIKLGLVGVLLVINAWHDFYVGPRAAESVRAQPGSADTHRLRRSASWAARLTLILSLAVVFLAVLLIRGGA